MLSRSGAGARRSPTPPDVSGFLQQQPPTPPPPPHHHRSRHAAPPQQRLLAMPLLPLVWRRLSVLVTLLLLQSLSQFVLEAYESLITTNVVIPLFLTMLIGAGGNAGNQAAVHAITGLATGELHHGHVFAMLRREFAVGLVSSAVLALIGFLRVYVFYTNEDVQPTGVFVTVFSISLSLFLIVLTSVVVGSALPFGLQMLGVNPEHAAPATQVVMDVLGVCIACATCSLFLPSTPPSRLAPPLVVPPPPLASDALPTA